MSSFQRKITKGVLWSAIDVLLRQGSQFVILIVMARILSPEDFGVMALLGLFIGLANVFVDGGFSSALIQRQNITRVDESTVFFFNLGMGLFVCLALCAAAPYIAFLFDKPILRPLTYALAINVFISAFGAIHITLLTRELDFKLIAKVSGVSSILAGVAGILLAVNGFGIWSLASQTLTATLLSTILLWAWHSWRPLWTFNFGSLRSFFRFGGYLLLTGIVDTLHINLYSILIGKFYHTREVGFYDRAQKTQLLPVNFIMQIINRVAFAAFSAVAEDKERLASAFRKAQRLVMFVNIPLSVTMMILAEPIVITLFGEKWLPSAPILQVLGVVGLIWPMHVLNINVLQAQGRSDLFFNIMLIKKTVAISLTVAGSFHGIMGLAWAQVAASAFALLVNAYFSKVFLNLGAIRQVLDLLPSFAAAVPMGAAMWLVNQGPYSADYVGLAIGLLTGGILYLLLTYLFKAEALRELSGMLPLHRIQNLTPDRGQR
ncbi:MAG: lipopolysaccharide biosynthesis protein [Methylomicrobium sp.]